MNTHYPFAPIINVLFGFTVLPVMALFDHFKYRQKR